MKIRIDVRKLEKAEREMIKKNDVIKYEIEKMKRIERISSEAGRRNLKRISPADLIVLKKNNNGDRGNGQ